MGNFYTNITLRSAAHEHIASLLSDWGETAYLSPVIGGCIVVYPASTENQDSDLLQALAARLSTGANCPALAVLNHDDDVLAYWLFMQGRLVDNYDSSPGYFGDYDADETDSTEDDLDEGDMGDAPIGGDGVALCAAFGAPEDSISEIDEVLRTAQSWDEQTGYLFASDRHGDLVGPLGLPECAVGFGYTYLESGETPEDIDPDTLTHVSGA